GIHPVGRLDADSSGALLLTNDGAWTQAIAHPRAHLPKTYQVWVEGHPSESALQAWRQGIVLFGQKTLPAQVEVLTARRDRTLLQVILREGRNRQIRLVAKELGTNVLRLHRSAIGSLQLQPPHQPMLPRGAFRYLTNSEINEFKNSAPT
ncbi:MAG: pseudouridine synthase, partial [Cyanobacteriota bacterium]|nr:pseudouridine synthase [Cyanobacteriota bacterium]